MATPTVASSSLSTIQTKVRRLTRSPSENSLSTADLNQYINTFVLYDFAQHVRLYNLRSTLTFYTQPNVDVYETESTDVNDPLYDFKNRVVAIHPQVFIAGVPVFYTQDRDYFYGTYPIYNFIDNQAALADGTTGPFTGTLTTLPLLQNNVIFSTITTNNTAMTLVDYPQNGESGLLGYANTAPTALANFGSINYLTGVFSVTFPAATTDGNVITATTVPYQAGKPTAILFYDQKFTIRPVPDIAYSVTMQVDILPTELLASSQAPDISQWWQYIAFSTAKKIFEDRMDYDSINLLMPSIKEQEGLVISATSTVMANERSKTIYHNEGSRGLGFGWGSVGWPY
jgi:hypothetical protein